MRRSRGFDLIQSRGSSIEHPCGRQLLQLRLTAASFRWLAIAFSVPAPQSRLAEIDQLSLLAHRSASGAAEALSFAKRKVSGGGVKGRRQPGLGRGGAGAGGRRQQQQQQQIGGGRKRIIAPDNFEAERGFVEALLLPGLPFFLRSSRMFSRPVANDGISGRVPRALVVFF